MVSKGNNDAVVFEDAQGADNVEFDPTLEITDTNVQEAIESTVDRFDDIPDMKTIFLGAL